MLTPFLREMKKTLFPHAIAAHFSNGLIPVAVFFLLLFFPSGDIYFEHTVSHLLIIVLMAIPVSFVSGLYDWKTKYKSAKAPIFIKKIRLSILLFVLCTISVAIRLTVPGVMYEPGLLNRLYIALLIFMLPVVVLLGHYGGKLSAAQRAAGARKQE